VKVGKLFLAGALMSVEDVDFDFENAPTRIVLTRQITQEEQRSCGGIKVINSLGE
jgi:hypothetical protein